MLDRHKKEQWRRWLVLVFAAAAIALFVGAWFQPMWGWYLSAPQYPSGLVLAVYLNHVSGDITEINILNHYIGMAHLDEAAQFERAMAAYGVAAIAIVTMLMVFVPGKRFARYFAWPAFAFPAVFVAAMYWWMYKFGHELSEAAPVTVEPFTPTLIGHGQIGNFSTIGLPGVGFYMILAASACVIVAYFLRKKACAECVFKDQCKTVCPNLFLFDPKTGEPLPDKAGKAPSSEVTSEGASA